MEYPFTNQLVYIKRNVINVLLRNANADPFKVPVNPDTLQIPQYPRIIRCAMDFGTIKANLDRHQYQSANDCKNDFMDVFRNCYIFNEPGSMYVEMSLKLESLFHRKMSELPVPELVVSDSTLTLKSGSSKVKKSHGSSGKSHNKSTVSQLSTPSVVAPSDHPLAPPPSIPSMHQSSNNISTQKRARPSHVSTNSNFVDEPVAKRSKIYSIDFKTCKHIIQSLMSKRYQDLNRYFLQPVDVEGLQLHNYYDIIKKPMDLGTVKSKLLENRYQTNQEFAEDVRLIFRNCCTYNPEGHEVYRCGKLLESVFNKLYQNSFGQHKQHSHRQQQQQQQFTPSIAAAVPPTPTVHNPKRPRLVFNYDEVHPLLQRILRRQTEIETAHQEMMRRYAEIQKVLNVVNGTDLVRSYKRQPTSNHNSYPLSRKSSSQSFVDNMSKTAAVTPTTGGTGVGIVCKPGSSQSSRYSGRSNTPLATSSSTTTGKKPVYLSDEPLHVDTSSPVVRPSDDAGATAVATTDDSNVPGPCSNHSCNSSTSRSVDFNQTASSDNSQHKITSANEVAAPATSEVEESKPTALVTDAPTASNATPVLPSIDSILALINPVKEWMAKLGSETSMKVRENINKWETKTVVIVNLMKLRPGTVKGLHKMMLRSKEYSDDVETGMAPFSNEERKQLSNDMRQMDERHSSRILRIYKTYEEPPTNGDGECELDFQKMKLITLHRLREFALRCLQRHEERSRLYGNAAVAEEYNSESDSTDSSISNPISDSDGSSSSSSEDEEDENEGRKKDSQAVHVATAKPMPPSVESSMTGQQSQPVTASVPPAEVTPIIVVPEVATEPSSISNKKIDDDEQSRLSDSSDDDDNKPETVKANHAPTVMEDDEDDDDEDEEETTAVATTKLRPPKYTNLWSASTKHSAVNKSSLKHRLSSGGPSMSSVVTAASILSSASSTMASTSTAATGSITNSTSPSTESAGGGGGQKLHESLKQILQDAQAHENVKKHEEQLRQVRLREEQEQKKQQLIRIQQLNESKRNQHNSEQQKKMVEYNRIQELKAQDHRQRHIDIPAAVEREDYHQMLCDFEFNMDPELLKRLVYLDKKHVHL